MIDHYENTGRLIRQFADSRDVLVDTASDSDHTELETIAAITELVADGFVGGDGDEKTLHQEAVLLAEWRRIVTGQCSELYEHLMSGGEYTRELANQNPDLLTLNGIRRGVKSAMRRKFEDARKEKQFFAEAAPYLRDNTESRAIEDRLYETVEKFRATSTMRKLKRAILQTKINRLTEQYEYAIAKERAATVLPMIRMEGGKDVTLARIELAAQSYALDSESARANGDKEAELKATAASVDASTICRHLTIWDSQEEGVSRIVRQLLYYHDRLGVDTGGSYFASRFASTVNVLDELLPIDDNDRLTPTNPTTDRKHWGDYILMLEHPKSLPSRDYLMAEYKSRAA